MVTTLVLLWFWTAQATCKIEGKIQPGISSLTQPVSPVVHLCSIFQIFHLFHDIYIYFFNTLFIPFGKFGPPYLGKATEATRAALPSPTSAYCVFSCFRNPPNSDTDYGIFNVRT